MITIYGITDEHGQIRYVGQTKYPHGRFLAHKRGEMSSYFKVSGLAVLAQAKIQKWANRLEVQWTNFFGVENLFNVAARGSTDAEPLPKIQCQYCNKKFIPSTVWQRFCRDACRNHFQWVRRKGQLKEGART